MLVPEVIGLELDFQHFDISLEKRRATQNGILKEAAGADESNGLGMKAATITPPARRMWAVQTPSCGKRSTGK